jgi:hypothetical protein
MKKLNDYDSKNAFDSELVMTNDILLFEQCLSCLHVIQSNSFSSGGFRRRRGERWNYRSPLGKFSGFFTLKLRGKN